MAVVDRDPTDDEDKFTSGVHQEEGYYSRRIGEDRDQDARSRDRGIEHLRND